MGKTFWKKCKLTCNKCNKDKCNKMLCTDVYEPVCASDGKTYSNLCEFRKAKCKNPKLDIVSQGPCDSKPECPQICPENWDPVCGSDGKTYSNKCYFQAAKCLDPDLHIVSIGECGSKPDSFGMIDEDEDGFISLSEWLKKTKRASQNYGVNLTEDELKEMFSSMACGSDGISSKNFQDVINDEIADAPCAIERGPFWKWVKIAIKVVVVIIEICCLTDVCDC